MYDKLTDRSSAVLRLAKNEARVFSCERTNSEHILLGIFDEGVNVAAHALKSSGITLPKVMAAVKRVNPRHSDKDEAGDFTLTPESETLLVRAHEEMEKLGHSYIGPEHILLGILESPGSAAYLVLQSLSADLKKIRGEVMALLGTGEGESVDGEDAENLVYDAFIIFAGIREPDKILAEYTQKLNEFSQKGWMLCNTVEVSGMLIATVVKEG